MEITYKGVGYEYPTRLRDISLQQFITYNEQIVKPLELRQKEIEAMEDELDKDIETFQIQTETAARSLAFYTGIPYEEVCAYIEISQVISMYNTATQMLKDQENDITLEDAYDWNGSTWTIAPPELKAQSEMVLNEFLTAKEITRQMSKLGKGMWDSLPYLCAIYFRKVVKPPLQMQDEYIEPFTEDMVSGERLQLMYTLPLDLAFAVAFFLTDTIAIYNSNSAFSSLGRSINQP